MRYLTKEWYELCQRTGLHFGKRVHSGAYTRDESLYSRLYMRKEKQYIKEQRESYDYDPRSLLEQEGAKLVPARRLFGNEEIREEDILIYHMPPEQKLEIERMIAKYDARPPFDVLSCKQKFQELQEWYCSDEAERLPEELIQQIADIRVLALGYCTKEIMQQLKRLSEENRERINAIGKQYREAQQAEQIPDHIRERLHFHDCRVTEIQSDQDIIIRLDNEGEMTDMNQITLVAPEIVRLDEHVVGSSWLYDELYRVDEGYELHVLFSGREMPELIVRCEDIVVEER